MRDPRPEAFDSRARSRQPDAVDLSGVVPLEPKPPAEAAASKPVVSRYHGREGGGMVSRYHDTVTSSEADSDDLMKSVRKAVKTFGKEAATHRFTAAEKKTLAEIIFAYRGQGIRTSENEITRIAINFLFEDYKLNGQNSILHQCLVALNE